MIIFEAIGWYAAGLSMITFIPQVFYVYKRRSAKDISIISFSVLILSSTLWLIYGLSLMSGCIILTNVCNIICGVSILIMKKKFAQEHDNE